MLEGYENVVPGAADRIIRMAETTLSHKTRMEGRALDGTLAQKKRGQWLGLVVVVLAFLLAYLALQSGHEAFAETLVTITLVTLAGIFVLDRAPGWFRKWRTKGTEEAERPSSPSGSAGPVS